MAKFINEVTFRLPSLAEERRFSASEDLLRWIEAEGAFWASSDIERMNGSAKKLWQQEVSFFIQAKGWAQEFERKLEQNQEGEARQLNQHLQQHFANVSNGTIVTSDHEF